MPDVVTGLGGLSVIGGFIGGDQAADAASQAASTQAAASDRAAQMQMDMFRQSQAYTQPYRQGGYVAAPLLQYLSTGIMPEMSAQELAEIQRLQGLRTGSPTEDPAYFQNPLAGQTPTGSFTATAMRLAEEAAQKRNQPVVDQYLSPQDEIRLNQLLGKQQAVQAAQGGLQGMIEQSPMYQYQSDLLNKQLNRQLRARGRGNSTFGMNALAEANRGLLADESNRLYGRLYDLGTMGLGTASTSGSQALSTGANVGNAMIQSGLARGAGQLEAGQQRASMFSNAFAAPLQMYNTQQYLNALR